MPQLTRKGKHHKPRILLVGPFPPTRGGVTTFMLNLINSHLADSFSFIRFTTSRPPKSNVINNWGYGALMRGGFTRLITGASVTLWHFVIFPFVVLTRRIHLVQIQASSFYAFWESMCYLYIARLLGKPVLLRLGGAMDVFYDTSSALARRCIAETILAPNALIVQSRYWRKYLAGLGRRRGLVIVHNFVADDLPCAPATPRKTCPVCLFIAGSEAQRKGVDDVITAIKSMKARGALVRFRLLAVPPVLAERLDREDIADIAEATGYVDRDLVLREMRQADIFLLASHAEGFPNSLLEAMASGLAVVATNVGAVPDVLEDGEGGFLIDPGDVTALEHCIAALAADPERRAAMGSRNTQVIRRRFTARRALADLESAYWKLIQNQPG